MKTPALKTIVLSCSIVAVLIVALQLFWLTRVSNIHTNIITTDTSSYQTFDLWVIVAFLLIILLLSMTVILFYIFRKRFRQEAQKEILNNLMHEFKTPLAVMGIAGKVLETPGIEQQSLRLKKYAGIIKDQAAQLENNINRILEVALSERKDVVLAKEDIEVNTIIAKAITSLEPMIDERSAIVEFTPFQEPLRIHADEAYIQQVITNLLDNSLKYAPKPKIKIEVVRTKKTCIIAVNDNGIGIEKKYHRDIFRKFFRVPTGNVHNVKGFGIGLNFAKKVVDAHHGKIEVDSAPGIGSKFSIHMPLI